MATKTVYHRYRPHQSPLWFLSNRRYFAFMLRELAGLFIAVYAILIAVGLFAGRFHPVLPGPNGSIDVYASMAWLLKTRGFFVFTLISLAFACYHSLTWFDLFPQVTPIQIRGWKVPNRWVFGGMVALWIGLSLALYVVLYGGKLL